MAKWGESVMGVKLYDLNMTEIELRGVKWVEFTPDPPSSSRITDNVWDGDITLGKKRNSRNIQARFLYKSRDFADYKLLRDELFAIFDPLEAFYIVDTQIPGKRWRVEVDSYEPSRINGLLAEVTIILYSSKPYAESIGTTMDEETFNASMRYYGVGALPGASVDDYIHGTNNFVIHNAGNVLIDPRQSELLITLTSISATSSKITLTNNTTGDVWTYTGTFAVGSTITIDRTKSKKNGTNIVGDTNLQLISLAKGINNFTVTGLTGDFEIKFEFRYLYL